MYCRSCGSYNEDNAFSCVKCGQSLQAAQPPQQPMQPPTPMQPAGPQPVQGMPPGAYPPPQPVNDYLVWSILATVLCCLIGGIVAIIYSTQVKSKLALGDYAGAVQASNSAKTWIWVSAIVGFLVNAGWIALAIIGAIAGNNQPYHY